MALQDDLKKVGLNPANYTITITKTVNRNLVTETVFDEAAARAALNIKNRQIAEEAKRTRAEVSRITTLAKSKTQDQRLDDFNRQLSSAEARNFKITSNQRTILNTYANLAKTSKPSNFAEAARNYSIELSKLRATGADKLSASQKAGLSSAAKAVRNFDSKDLGPAAKEFIKNISDAEDRINSIAVQKDLVARSKKSLSGLSGNELSTAIGKLKAEEDKLARLVLESNQSAPKIVESVSRIGLADVAPQLTGASQRAKTLDTGLSDLSSQKVFATGTLFGKLNSQITDQQIIDDINTARRNESQRLFDLGTSVAIDLQSQITAAESLLPGLSASQRTAATKQINDLRAQLAEVQSDTLQAQNLVKNFVPISGDQAVSAVTNFRESLRLPEERTLNQIREIDPNLFNSINALGQQYSMMAASGIGPTMAEGTEALRQQTEETIANQLRLGSQLGAEEQRQYQQAARAAQTARGNIFGVGPAVQEAVTTGLAGEQRLAARLGAAQGFLSSGQNVSDALARDVSLRNALQQSRLGAATSFAAAGPSIYNLASQRASQQQALLQQYAGGATQQAAGQVGGFQATPTAMTPYAYVNPQAGFIGAQNAASIYNTMQQAQASMYGDYTRAQASQPTFAQQFGSILSGVSGFIPSFSFSK